MPTRYRSRRRPRFSRRRRTRRTSRFRSRRGRRSYTVRLTRQPVPFASRYLVKLKYVETYVASSPGGGIASVQQWNLNSIHDPNRTGTGHQPYGHDTLATLFARYRVWKTSWRIRITSSTNIRAACGVENTNAFTADVAVMGERPRYIVKNGTLAQPTIFRGSISLYKLNGSTPTQYKADDRFQAPFGSSPGELLVLNCVLDGDGGQTAAFGITATLVFYTECFDPLTLTQS